MNYLLRPCDVRPRQAIEVDASPLLQIPYVKSVPPKGAPTLKEAFHNTNDNVIVIDNTNCYSIRMV